MTTGRLVMAMLHLINQMPVEWFSKKQATVETATYGLELVAARLAVQQSMGICNMLQYLGISVKGSTHLFGDNGLIVTIASQPNSPLCKWHLSYHYTRESISSDTIDFQFLPGHMNPALGIPASLDFSNMTTLVLDGWHRRFIGWVEWQSSGYACPICNNNQ